MSGVLLLCLSAPSTVFANALPADAPSSTTPTEQPTATTGTSANSSSATDHTANTTTTTTSNPATDTPSKPSKPTTPAPAVTQQAQRGPTSPPGAASSTYTYNASTGLWENGYYAWNPSTDQTTPLTPQTYSYNPSTGMWDTTQYVYNAVTGTYDPNTVSVSTPPAGAGTTDSNTSSSSSTASTDGSTPTTNNSNTNNAFFDNFYNASISNDITANAQSGDTLVVGNTTGGSATTGNALDLANVINLVQSATGLSGNALTTFVDNITGDVNGDLLIDPRLLQAPTDPNNVATNIDLNSTTNGQIDNNVALAAGSGNATVADNTTGGNATSGNADAVADIMNVINSIIASGQSFLGVVNIYGNFTGNILVPSDLLNSLVATNGSTGAAPTNATTTVSNTADQAINNQIDTTAQTGQATVSDNTAGGSATSGSATTNVTVFNLTGNQIVGSNDLLVFVNVLGQWVGFIMNAPAGTTAAEIGGGITSDTTNGSTASIGNTNNASINNNVQVAAQSGDATVNHNTTGGNATSGNADASVNLLNMENSDLSLTNWFGILFINVFGNWFGSLEAATNLTNSTTSNSASTAGDNPVNSIRAVSVFRFIPTNTATSYVVRPMYTATSGGSTGSSASTTNSIKTAAFVSYTAAKPATTIHTPKSTSASAYQLSLLPIVASFVGIGVLGADQFRAAGRNRTRRTITAAILSKLSRSE